MSKIYYLVPDLFRADFNLKSFLANVKKFQLRKYIETKIIPKHKPIGGIKVMYQHCMMLNEMGYDAQPLTMGKYKGNFFGYDLDYVSLSEIGTELTPDDIVVSTEMMPYDGLKFSGARKILFMQNWINITSRLNETDRGKSYIDLGYDYVMTCGRFCTEMVEIEMGIHSATVTNGIDQSKFFPRPEKRVPGRVLVLSRKNYEDFERIKSLCGGKVDFRIVDGLTQDQLIEEYQQADIFLATGYPEGLPLPPLEAMNTGCVVVGFTGGGASEYMLDTETAMVATDGDCEAAANKLMQVLSDDELKERLRGAGHKKAQTYTLDNMAQELGNFYKTILN